MTTQAHAALIGPDIETTIAPTRGWSGPKLRELWAYRELLAFFVWRDLKVRYKQTLFGALWAVIQPVLLMAVFSLFLGRLGGIAPANVPYSLFAFAGLVPWLLFSKSLASSSDSLVASANLVQKVYFPRLLLPLSSVGSLLVDYAIALVVLIAMGLYFGYVPTLAILWLVPLTGLVLLAALAPGLWLSAANVRFRDVRQLIPFLVQIWLFASPVAYAADIVPTQWRWLYQLNPMANVIEMFRWAAFDIGAPPEFGPALVSIAATTVVLVTGLMYFGHVERTMADAL